MSDRFDHTLEHALKTNPDDAGPDDGGDDVVTRVQRIELITGAGRRRQWRQDDKARIIVESLMPGTNVSEVARRNGLSPQQLFGWRREARELMAEAAGSTDTPAFGQARSTVPRKPKSGARPLVDAHPSTDCAPAFASVVIASPGSPSPPSPPAPPASGRIEIAIGDATVRIIGPVEPALLATVLRAVRRAT